MRRECFALPIHGLDAWKLLFSFSYSGSSSYEYGCSANLVKIFGDPFFVGKTESSPDHCTNRAFILDLICSLTSVPSSKASKENLLMISPFLNMVSSPSVLVSFSSFCRRSTIFLVEFQSYRLHSHTLQKLLFLCSSQQQI